MKAERFGQEERYQADWVGVVVATKPTPPNQPALPHLACKCGLLLTDGQLSRLVSMPKPHTCASGFVASQIFFSMRIQQTPNLQKGDITKQANQIANTPTH
eukprot:GGOE01034670.1.p2 GENE.GGOE01034670.1~~GGOE01034670.1.p2  ORF type:complete len:101 (-),score=2.43 GGOE01034670.1:189-491(-)